MEASEYIHLHFPVIEQHAIHFLNGSFSRLLSLKVHKAVAFRAILVTNHLTGREHMQLLKNTHTDTNMQQQVYLTWTVCRITLTLKHCYYMVMLLY